MPGEEFRPDLYRGAPAWTPETVVGFLYSTSVLSRDALGELAPDFETDLLGELRRTRGPAC